MERIGSGGKEIVEDVSLQQIMRDLQADSSSWPGYSFYKGKLFYKNILVILINSSIIAKLLEEFHSTPSGGHSRFLLTYCRLTVNVYYKGMKT